MDAVSHGDHGQWILSAHEHRRIVVHAQAFASRCVCVAVCMFLFLFGFARFVLFEIIN